MLADLRKRFATVTNPTAPTQAQIEAALPPSAVSNSHNSGVPAVNAARQIEDYSSVPIVSGITDCTAAINALLADTESLKHPLEMLGKVYMTKGEHSIPSYFCGRGCGFDLQTREGTFFELIAGSGAVNVLQSASWGSTASFNQCISLSGIGINGNMFAQPENGVNACPQTYLMVEANTANEGIAITVASTEHFPASGLIWVGLRLVNYTGKTATEFTGCTPVGTGSTLKPGAWVVPHGSVGHGLALQAALGDFDIGVFGCQGSNVLVQGIPGQIAYQNCFRKLEAHTCNRFALEFGEEATDNDYGRAVLGGNCGMGLILDRNSGDNAASKVHLIGQTSTMDAAIVLASSGASAIANPYFDSIPYHLIRIDTRLRGDFGITDPQITDINGVFWNYAGAKTNSAITTRRKGNAQCSRGKFSGVIGNSTAPHYEHGFYGASTAAAGLVGEQNPTTLSTAEGGSGLLQLDSVAGFLDAPTTTDTLTVGTDTLTYVSRSKAVNRLTAEAAIGATVVKMSKEVFCTSSAFKASGTVLIGGGTTGLVVQEVAYTGYNAGKAELTGVTGITTAIPAGAMISQCFLTGISGAKSKTSYVDGHSIFAPGSPMLAGTLFELDYGTTNGSAFSPEAGDAYNTRRGWQRNGKPSYARGTVEVKAGTQEATFTHGLLATPTDVAITAHGPLGAKALPPYAEIGSATIVIRVPGEAGYAGPPSGVVFSVMAECAPTA